MIDKDTLTVVVEIDDNPERNASSLFRKNRKILVEEMKLPCWLSGSFDDLEVHHTFEWSEFSKLDPDKCLAVLEKIDWYGFGAKMKGQPMTSVDDIRNLVVLSRHYHTDRNNGIHNLPFPVWIAQGCTKDGVDITPDDIAAYLRKK